MRSLLRKLRPVKLRLSFFYWMAGVVLLIALSLWVGSWGVRVSQDWATLQQAQKVEPKTKFDASLDVVKAIVGGIGTIATIGGGVVLYLNFKVAQKKLEQETKKAEADAKLAESRLLLERFNKAVEMLGNDKSIHLRLGGIYALEGIARDSSDDKIDDSYRQFLEVLTAFVRENSPYPPRKQVEKESAIPPQNTEPLRAALRGKHEDIPPLKTDIQAALTVLNRRKHKDTDWEEHPLDLRKTELGRASLENANLKGANLGEANLKGASLKKANLQQAKLEYANLQGASLTRANLQQATLIEANLQHATLMWANLQKASLTRANLQETYLIEANLQGASLVEANLQQAKLGEANLQGASLEYANLQEANLRKANFKEANLEYANLQYADLSSANLSGAVLLATDLRHAKNFDPNQLEGDDPPLLCHVALPEGFKDQDKLKDRDCDQVPAVLRKLYPFLTDTEAAQEVNKARQEQWK